MYKLALDPISNTVSAVWFITEKGTLGIPFAPANTDYQQFKKDVLAGAELQDADGNVMTQEEATAFIGTLP